MKTLKSIDGKSLLIGGLLASTIFFAMGATSKTDAGKWDKEQVWITANQGGEGWEPFAYDSDNEKVILRKRIK
mgnify:CR=1 FL=1